MVVYTNTDELYHYGIPGMKWGHRKAVQIKTNVNSRYGTKGNISAEQQANRDRAKKVVKVGAAVAATALATYGAYKYSKYRQNATSERHYKIGRDYVARQINMESKKLDSFANMAKSQGASKVYQKTPYGSYLYEQGNGYRYASDSISRNDYINIGKKQEALQRATRR